MFDLLFTGARVFDGTGTPWHRADVAVAEGKIVAVGRLRGQAARRVMAADGRALAPGFIDIHTHSDLHLLADPLQPSKTLQGVTTEVLGHDGLGLAPVTAETAAALRRQLVGWNGDPDVAWEWSTISTYLDNFDGQVAVNVAMLVPHGTVRMAIMGNERREPTANELERMQAMVVQGLEEGAFGLSTGLTYTPAMYATDEELVALCQAMRPYHGVYVPHHRNYGMEALKGYADSIAIGRSAGVPVHLTHCHLGFPVNEGRAPELLALIDAARQRGVEVTLDTYPYLAGNTYLHANLPSWVQEGGVDETLARLRAPALREQIRQEMEVTGSDGIHGVPLGWEMIQIAGITGEGEHPLAGMYIPEAAARAGKSPFDFFTDLLLETRLGVSCLVHLGIEENLQAIMQHPAHTVGSDGILVGQRPHPRGWGSHARFLAHYTRELGLFTWEEAIRRMTSAAAWRIGALDRGVIRPGANADLVLFDQERIQDTATYENPRRHPEGIDYVAVNGVLVVDEGRLTGATPGRALRSPFGRRPVYADRIVQVEERI